MVQKLSEVLVVRSEFSFFQSIANLEPFDLSRLDSVVDEVLTYVTSVKGTLKYIDSLPNDVKTSMDWLAEGRNKFYEIYRNLDSIDSLVLQSLNLLETNFDKDPNIADSGIFDKLDVLGELSLDIKQNYLLAFKNKVDVSTEYNEIFNITMNSINNELENCLKKCFRIHERRFSSPVRHAPHFNLDLLTKKLFKQKSGLRLPLLTEIENQLYEEFLDLKGIVDPLKASLQFIPMKITEFQEKHKELDQGQVTRITNKYNSLMKELDFLQNEVNDLKFELVDKRWSEIFSYLNTEMSFLITSVHKETNKLAHLKDTNSSIEGQILKKVKYTTHIVDNTFILINQAIDEKLIDFSVVEKSNGLAERWLDVKGSIPAEYLIFLEAEEEDFEELKKFKTLTLDDGNQKREDSSNTPVKNKRRSRAGEFFMGKLNLKPVMIETNPTSAMKRPDPKEVPKNVLADSVKHNKLDVTPSKSTMTNIEAINFQKIPDLKSSLSQKLTPVVHEYLASPPSDKSDTKSMSPIKEVQTPENIKIEYPAYESKNVFETPRVSSLERRRSLQASSASVSRLPVPSRAKESQATRIPRPSSRLGALDRESSLSKDKSQLFNPSSQRSTSRPSSALASTRLIQSERPPSRAGVLNKRHSMIPQTPVRAHSRINSSDKSSSRRRSLLPQPTPVKEIIERSSSRLSDRRSSAELRGHRVLDRPDKPIWR